MAPRREYIKRHQGDSIRCGTGLPTSHDDVICDFPSPRSNGKSKGVSKKEKPRPSSPGFLTWISSWFRYKKPADVPTKVNAFSDGISPEIRRYLEALATNKETPSSSAALTEVQKEIKLLNIKTHMSQIRHGDLQATVRLLEHDVAELGVRPACHCFPSQLSTGASTPHTQTLPDIPEEDVDMDEDLAPDVWPTAIAELPGDDVHITQIDSSLPELAAETFALPAELPGHADINTFGLWPPAHQAPGGPEDMAARNVSSYMPQGHFLVNEPKPIHSAPGVWMKKRRQIGNQFFD